MKEHFLSSNQGLFDRVGFMMLTKYDNDVTNYTSVIYAEKET